MIVRLTRKELAELFQVYPSTVAKAVALLPAEKRFEKAMKKGRRTFYVYDISVVQSLIDVLGYELPEGTILPTEWRPATRAEEEAR